MGEGGVDDGCRQVSLFLMIIILYVIPTNFTALARSGTHYT